MSGQVSTIYVALLNEGTPAWRLVKAEKLDEAKYRIMEQSYDRETEEWEFPPGAVVVCEWRALSEGDTLVAIRRTASEIS